MSISPIYHIIKCYDDLVPQRYSVQKNYSGSSYTSWYIRTGGVRVETSDEHLNARSGDWVFIEPMTVKSHWFKPLTHIVSIRFSVNWNHLHFFPPLRTPRLVNGTRCPSMLKVATELCRWQQKIAPNMNYPLAADARRTELFSSWLYHWHKLRESHTEDSSLQLDPRVSKAISEWMRSPGITPIDGTQLSHTSGLSLSQINRIFKRATGQTIKGWQDTVCLKLAEKMLLSSGYSIKEIAARLRFRDASHFVKWFRNHMNATPGQWRKIQ